MSHTNDRTTKRVGGSIEHIHQYGLDPEKRELYLFGMEEYAEAGEDSEPGVEYTMANRFIKNLRILQGLSADPVLIHMKTCGGHWQEGIAIYQAIKACPCHITILNYTHARSMSSIIFQAADRRAMMPYSTFMFHDGTIGVSGTVKQFLTEAEQVNITQEQMFKIYLDEAEGSPAFEGKSRSQIKKWMRDRMNRKEDVYLAAQETVDHGWADFVFGGDGTYDWNRLR